MREGAFAQDGRVPTRHRLSGVCVCSRLGGISCKGLSLMSGGLDSQLAVRVLEGAGAVVEAVCFVTPFFDPEAARTAAAALGVKLHIIDFTDDEIALIEHPPHGFGGAMNPCIDCHAMMIRRAGELMTRLGFDFVATVNHLGTLPFQKLCEETMWGVSPPLTM
jgi:tRNA U34 2-thiouridine synthase MnmA/TrmU